MGVGQAYDEYEEALAPIENSINVPRTYTPLHVAGSLRFAWAKLVPVAVTAGLVLLPSPQ